MTEAKEAKSVEIVVRLGLDSGPSVDHAIFLTLDTPVSQLKQRVLVICISDSCF